MLGQQCSTFLGSPSNCFCHRDGLNCVRNLQPMCGPCNRRKTDEYRLKEKVKRRVPPEARRMLEKVEGVFGH